MSTARKYSIEYFYRHHYGAPPEDAWDEYDGAMRLPTIIMKHLAMPHGSYPLVVTAMLDIHAAGIIARRKILSACLTGLCFSHAAHSSRCWSWSRRGHGIFESAQTRPQIALWLSLGITKDAESG